MGEGDLPERPTSTQQRAKLKLCNCFTCPSPFCCFPAHRLFCCTPSTSTATPSCVAARHSSTTSAVTTFSSSHTTAYRSRVCCTVGIVHIAELLLLCFASAVAVFAASVGDDDTSLLSLVPRGALMPIAIFLCLLILFCCCSLVGLRMCIPIFVLVYAVASLLTQALLGALAVQSVRRLISQFDWSMVCITSVLVLLFLGGVFSIILKLQTFRLMARAKRSITVCTAAHTDKVEATKRPPTADSISFSRRPTLVITDEFFEPPPKM